MEYLYEAIVHQKDLPIKIFTHTLEQYPYHWHEDTELLLILKGACEMRVGNEQFILREEDLFVINKDEVHYTKSTSPNEMTEILVLQFDLSHFSSVLELNDGACFRITEKRSSQDKMIQGQIKTLMARLMFEVLEHNKGYRVNVEMMMLRLLSILAEHYATCEKPEGTTLEHGDQRLLSILKYIDSHHMDADLSLNQIADAFYMNPQYLSRYFKTHIGLSLKKFIDNMRLNKSLVALQMTEERIIDIALKYGFPDAKAYYRVFKEVLGGTPQTYREKHKIENDVTQAMDYFNINSRDTFAKLNQYLESATSLSHKRQHSSDEDTSIVGSATIKEVALNLGVEVQPNLVDQPNLLNQSNLIDQDNLVDNRYLNDQHNLVTYHKHKKSALKLMTFGYAGHGLRADFKDQLKQIKADIGFEYVRFHGIFSDEFNLCQRDANGSIQYNFDKIDQLLDTLLENKVRPFLELGFMPNALASNEKNLFLWRANLSAPKHLSEWEELIETFIKHLLNRYGLNEVAKWYFEFWNEPEIRGVFWHDTDTSFFEFYKTTYQTIKRIEPSLRVGGFGNLFFSDEDDWLKKFADYATENDVKIDFYTFHIYNFFLSNNDFVDDILSDLKDRFDNIDVEKIVQMQKNKVFLGSSEQMHQNILDITEKAKHLPFSDACNPSLWITEWNTNTNGRELIRDTAYTGAFILKTVFENDHLVEGMGFWTFTDIFEELMVPDQLFHGGFGLMTVNGLKKPAYRAFEFLDALSEDIVFSTEDMRVTRTGDTYQILMHHYCHYNDLYASMDFSQITHYKRDTVFGKVSDKVFRLSITGLEGKYRIEHQYVNSDHGSVYDGWIKMGAPNSITKEAYTKLVATSEPGYLYQEFVFNKESVLELSLKPHEIRLLKLTPIY